jgi:hypothetical protein
MEVLKKMCVLVSCHVPFSFFESEVARIPKHNGVKGEESA